jgi:HAD superfamily hydrolase (TIGR01509 family)
MNEIAAVIFDCDGVMFDSKGANLAFYNRIFAEFGYAPVELEHKERAHICHTASSANVLKSLMRDVHLEDALDFAMTLDYREFIPAMIPVVGLMGVLESLHGRLPLAVATNRGGSIVPVLEHFDLRRFFDVVVNCKDVPRPKPAPDMLFLVVERLGVAPGDCLFIGDSELDMQAAQGAQIRFASYGDAVEGAEFSLRKLSDLLDHLGITGSGG